MTPALGCGGGSDDAEDDRTAGGEAPIARERCVGEGLDERGVDLDGDRLPDVVHVFRGERRVCSALDPDADGDFDVVRFYESDGERPRLEEHDLDFDGRIDLVALYAAGRPVRQQLDTDFDDRFDVFLACEDGLVARARRIRSAARGQVDTWETYREGYLEEARFDDDGDGEADRVETYRGGKLVREAVDRNRDGTFAEDETSEVEEEFAGERLLAECETEDVRARFERPARTAPAAAAPPGAPMPWDEAAPSDGAAASTPAGDAR